MDICSLENNSDDEVFFGQISLKEVKKHIFLHTDRSSLPCPNKSKEESNEDAIKIIDTNSEPNMSLVENFVETTNSVVKTEWDLRSTDDSFLRLEKMVSEMCMSPKSNEDLDNTLEVVEFILKNAPKKYTDCDTTFNQVNTDCDNNTINIVNERDEQKTVEKDDKNKLEMKELKNKLDNFKETPIKYKSNNNYVRSTKAESFLTPTNKQNEHVFKTPKNVSSKKQLATSTKKTPNRLNAYQHVASPVAYYIKNCPQVPLIKDIHLKKPLNSASSIPKLLKNPIEHKTTNKENISLPSVAYKSAKKTKMIAIPDTEKLPSSQWAKKLSNSLPKPTVIKHDHREINSNKKRWTARDEDSFIDLPLKQADLSVCTKKSAFNKPM